MVKEIGNTKYEHINHFEFQNVYDLLQGGKIII